MIPSFGVKVALRFLIKYRSPNSCVKGGAVVLAKVNIDNWIFILVFRECLYYFTSS